MPGTETKEHVRVFQKKTPTRMGKCAVKPKRTAYIVVPCPFSPLYNAIGDHMHARGIYITSYTGASGEQSP